MKFAVFILLATLFTRPVFSADVSQAKYSPQGQKILMFIGQDNASVGGTEKWNNGYVDTVGVPAGITHYVYFDEGNTNPFGFTFAEGDVDGLNSETTWGAGPMCLSCYMQSGKLAGTLVHLSISMEHDTESKVASGEYDLLIEQLGDFLLAYPERKFFLRIGYEFDGSWNHYEPKAFIAAWRRIVDALRARRIENFAAVMASSRYFIEREIWDKYWPGDEYVDWLGYSYWHSEVKAPVVFDLAREKGKPVFVSEVTPRGFWLNQTAANMIWEDWFTLLFDHIEMHKDVIRAVSYINTNWDAVPMWRGWGDSRIQLSDELRAKWLGQMDKPLYVHGVSELNEILPSR